MKAFTCCYLQLESLVQDSLGFSPFELVFGHNVRGPLKLLKEKILAEENTPLNLLQYVADFRHNLSKVCEIARSYLKSSQTKMKIRYDLKRENLIQVIKF